MGRALQKLVGWRELQSMYGRVWGKDSLEKGKGGVWGEGLPRKRKISSQFLDCSQSKCTLQIIQFFPNVILEVEQKY